MKIVITYVLSFIFIWLSGAAWCWFMGFRVEAGQQLTIAFWIVSPIAAIFSKIINRVVLRPPRII